MCLLHCSSQPAIPAAFVFGSIIAFTCFDADQHCGCEDGHGGVVDECGAGVVGVAHHRSMVQAAASAANVAQRA